MIGHVKLYYVIKDKLIYSVTSSRKEAVEYIAKALKHDNFTHYKAWCDLRDLDYKDDSNWFIYCNNVEVISEYDVKVYEYNKKEVATCMRLAIGCNPIGCSFDTDTERELMAKDLLEKAVEQAFNEVTENSVKN